MLTPLKSRPKALEFALIALAVALGLCRAWVGRNWINPDGISYLDLGDAYMQGHWSTAVNGYWNPFYPWLLGFALKILRPSMAWEFPVVHFLNFLIYLAALVSFRFLWTGLMHYDEARRQAFQKSGLTTIPAPVWITLGYTIFIVSTLEFIGLENVGADLCLATFVYLAAGLIIRLRMKQAAWMYVLLGITIGFAYLSKAALLPVAGTFVLAACCTHTSAGNLLMRASLVVAGIALIITPYIAALSKKQGHLTFTESAKINYGFMINGCEYWWSGDSPGCGTPTHPRTQLFAHPAAYQFKDHVAGTYPGWYDPAYWLAGMTPHFNLRQQLVRIKTDGLIFFDVFFSKFQASLITGALLWYVFGAGWGWIRRGVMAEWFLWLPPLAVLAMYLPVWAEPRFIGPYLGLFWAGVFASVRIPDLPHTRKLLNATAAAMAVVTLLVVFASTAVAIDQMGTNPPVQRQVAEYLQRIGIRPGDRVGAVGRVMDCGWARLGQVQITAEINHGSDADFRSASEAVKSQALAAMFRTGIKAIVSDQREGTGCKAGWRAAGGGFYVCTP